MDYIILRFRDTENINTIKEHKSIIDNKGQCWWGWWKKANEPDRYEKLVDIRDNIAQYKIYLFDRSINKFYVVKCEEVMFPQKNNIQSCPNKSICPNYYSNTKLNAWFRFTEISEISETEILNIIKKIPSHDYTFFVESDIASEQIEKNKIITRIQLQSDNILHLSDIHLGEDYGFPHEKAPTKGLYRRTLLEIICDHINNDLKKKIGLLVISGDIITKAKSDDLHSDGIEFIKLLNEKLDVPKEATIIIPGNHDIPLKNVDFLTYKHESSFRLFLKEYYGVEKDLFGLEYFMTSSGKKLDILRINSVKLRSKEEQNYGYVDWYLYKNMLNNACSPDSIKIAVLHHHLVSVPIEEAFDPTYPYGSISVTIDSGRVIEGLQKSGFKLVLNGHQHLPGITKIARGIKNSSNTINTLNNDLYILSAGSAGAKLERLCEQLKKNTFSIYTLITDKKIEVTTQSYYANNEPELHYNATIEF